MSPMAQNMMMIFSVSTPTLVPEMRDRAFAMVAIYDTPISAEMTVVIQGPSANVCELNHNKKLAAAAAAEYR
jgi:hypothetical protein